jgi:MFS family permease
MRFSSLYSRDYRLLWTGQVISFTGTWMHTTAQGWLVYSLTGSPLYLGLVSVASSLPVMLFTLYGGVIADRFRKRNLLLLTQAVSILPALAIGALASAGIITVWQVMALAAVFGTVNAFDIPARHSFLVEIAGKGNLLNAIAMNSAAFNGARIIGPVVAGMAIAHIGIPACFYLNALSFIPVLIALSMIKVEGRAEVYGKRSIVSEFMEGMRFVTGEADVFRALLMLVTFSLFGIPFVTFLPVFAQDILHVGAKGLGFLAGSAGCGAFLAALMIAFKAEVKGKTRYMKVAALIFPASLFAFSLSRDYYYSMAFLVLAGWGVVSFLALANSAIQLKTPDAIRGRVMSVYTLLFLGMAPVGNAIMGFAADYIGTPVAVSLASIVCFLVSLMLGAGMKGAGE